MLYRFYLACNMCLKALATLSGQMMDQEQAYNFTSSKGLLKLQEIDLFFFFFSFPLFFFLSSPPLPSPFIFFFSKRLRKREYRREDNPNIWEAGEKRTSGNWLNRPKESYKLSGAENNLKIHHIECRRLREWKHQVAVEMG